MPPIISSSSTTSPSNLIRRGKAYVDSLERRADPGVRGTLTEPGRESPYRDRSMEENLDLFQRMRAGEFADGAHVLRAKIDMAHPNMLMRDPYLVPHPQAEPPPHRRRAGASIPCTISPIACPMPWKASPTPSAPWSSKTTGRCTTGCWTSCRCPAVPGRYEFARLNLTYTVLSKRKLIQLVQEGQVDGWDDPRMPTISGLRRRGYTPEAIRNFCETHRRGQGQIHGGSRLAGIQHPRRPQPARAPDDGRAAALEGGHRELSGRTVEELEAVNNPEDPAMGTRKVPFSGESTSSRKIFMEDPPKKYYRLAPGREVRLRYAYFITCRGVVKDPHGGEIVELRCTYDPATRGGDAPDGRKVKATLHWVSAEQAVDARGAAL